MSYARSNPDIEGVLILGALAVIGYLVYKGYHALPSAASVSSAIDTAEYSFHCGNASLASYMPFGMGALSYPDDFVLPCAGAVTVGMLRAAGTSDTDIINAIANAACACDAAHQQGLKIQDNVIVGGS